MKQLNFGSTNGKPNDPNKTVVHCPTQELAQKVLRIADSDWCSGDCKMYERDNFSKHGSSTCYNLMSGSYSSKSFYDGYLTILPAEEFIRLNTPELSHKLLRTPFTEVKSPFVEGDKVFAAPFGWGVILEFANYPDFIRINMLCDGQDWVAPAALCSFTEYTLQGFSQERPKPDIKEGQLIYVRHEYHTEWLMRFFSHFDGDDVRYFLGQKKTGKTQVAKQYSLTNPLEEK